MGAVLGWSKSINILNYTAKYFNLGMKVKRPTYQYINPMNKPDKLDKVALDFFLSSGSEDAKYFSRKVMGKKGHGTYITSQCM